MAQSPKPKTTRTSKTTVKESPVKDTANQIILTKTTKSGKSYQLRVVNN